MEGDIALGGMPLIITIVGAILAGVFGLLRWFVARIMADIDERLDRIDIVAGDVSRVDGDLKRLIAELPLHYQRREDAIREYTTLNAQMARIYEVLLEIKNAK